MSAVDAYRALAPIYDEFNSQNDYEGWFSVLLPELEARGLPEKGRLLDVGCGTGRAFEPMIRRGWGVKGCDASKEMLEQAEAKFGNSIPLLQADVRDLPVLGGFDLVWALNDVMNYLTGDGDLKRALASMKGNLSPDGLLVVDLSSFHFFQLSFTVDGDGEIHDRGWKWEGLAREVRPGGTFEARLSGEGVESHIHRERHYTTSEVTAAMHLAGLTTVGALGLSESQGKVLMDEPADELEDLRVVYVGKTDTSTVPL